MRKNTIILLLLFVSINLSAQTFEHYFTDKTLRLDYIFSGNADKQWIALDKLNTMSKWYGKRKHLAEVPIQGNGQIIVKAKNSNQVIYRNSFSTLFQEWITYDEAKTTTRSFENVFLVPMPKDTVNITVELYNNRHQTIATMTHRVVPSDILIHEIGQTPTPYVTLQKAADSQHCINIAYLAEGYTAEELQSFIDDSNIAMEALFAHEPFSSRRQLFNVVAVCAYSEESGTSEPSKGIWKNTALGSHFDTFYSDRYLTTLNLKRMHDLLAGTPYEHIIVLVNTDKYGGGGILNSYNLSMTHHEKFRPVVVHEFGHSFAGLADEYAYESEDLDAYPLDIEPWEKNITIHNDSLSKWHDMVTDSIPNIGYYEGAGYRTKGMYRPSHDCRMRTNENPTFCAVCQRAIINIIDFYTK